MHDGPIVMWRISNPIALAFSGDANDDDDDDDVPPPPPPMFPPQPPPGINAIGIAAVAQLPVVPVDIGANNANQNQGVDQGARDQSKVDDDEDLGGVVYGVEEEDETNKGAESINEGAPNSL